MADDLPWFPLYAGRFLTDEKVLLMSLEERGAYTTLLCYQWIEGSIPSDEGGLAALLRVNGDAIAPLWHRIKGCFAPLNDTPERLVNPKLEEIREEQHSKLQQKRDAGKKGAKARWGKTLDSDGAAMAPPMRPQSDTNGNRQEKKRVDKKTPPKPPQGGEAYPLDFVEWWELYPKKVGKAAALRAWKTAVRRVAPGVILHALRGQLPALEAKESQYRPNPSTWLNQGRWDDEAPSEPEPDRGGKKDGFGGYMDGLRRLQEARGEGLGGLPDGE
jgi:uncharacterized protein YdaU (DUF1376 family)